MIRPPHRQALKSERPREQVNSGVRPSAAQIADAELRAIMPHRDLTGEILGDPPIGRSALDAKRRIFKP